MPIEKHSITASWWEYNKTDVDRMEVFKGRSVCLSGCLSGFIFLFPLLVSLEEILLGCCSGLGCHSLRKIILF